MTDSKFDWLVIGAGAAGISIAEMLSRMGKSVLIIEKRRDLAGETSRIFHEWLHTGALYTLLPDRLRTTRYLLGAMDDLLAYYSCFNRMNLRATESGLLVSEGGWFNDESIFYRYRNRPSNILWSLSIARASWLINEIESHDWLRRRAGTSHDGFRLDLTKILKFYPRTKQEFIEIRSPDVTMNSRILLTDLVDAFEQSDGKIVVDCDIKNIIDHGNFIEAQAANTSYFGDRAVICCADGISRFSDAKVKVSYAPMFVVDGVDAKDKSFVELDYITKSCINLLSKGGGYGLAGGISVSSQGEIDPYYRYCIDLHKKRNPNLRVLERYVGLKKELVLKGEDRNYLYHINQISENVWGVVLGKFSLIFSLAPEFIRRAYHVNPPHFHRDKMDFFGDQHKLLSNTKWFDVVNRGVNNGDD